MKAMLLLWQPWSVLAQGRALNVGLVFPGWNSCGLNTVSKTYITENFKGNEFPWADDRLFSIL